MHIKIESQSIDQVTISENNNNNLPRNWFKKLFVSLKFQSANQLNLNQQLYDA